MYLSDAELQESGKFIVSLPTIRGSEIESGTQPDEFELISIIVSMVTDITDKEEVKFYSPNTENCQKEPLKLLVPEFDL